METTDLGHDAQQNVQEILGYLNFSSGASDPGFLKNLSELFGRIAQQAPSQPAWQTLAELLRDGLKRLSGTSDAFRQVDQAEFVLRLVFDEVLPAYRRHHRDLLFHQTDESLFQPYFLGRVCEAVLQEGGPWDETERTVDGAVRRLNDFLGYRPVAVLQTEQKIQPYAHEYVGLVPLYVRGAGVAVGRYHELIQGALAILEATDSTLLFQAWFDPSLLEELAVDPRAYDFDHPVNKRPNYLFGQWDMHRLDNSGRCRRFVVQQVSLDAMLERIENRDDLPREEMLFEASAVLAGTMLMGSGISGNRADAHGSDVTLATLVQHIAGYRDTFYKQLLERLSGPHAERLKQEMVDLLQPLGGARQDFNHRLALRRAAQLQHVHLAQVFARMGYNEAAARQVRQVPVTSARMTCDVYCHINTAQQKVADGRFDEAAALLPEIEALLHRAIECGALADPWNVLGFGGQFPLFPAVENSVYDHRVDELIDLMASIFGLYVQIRKEAAAKGDTSLHESLSERLERLAQWWDKFATVEVSQVESISGRETCESADHVAGVLAAWHEAGTAAGDVAFWRRHIEQFRSPRAYAVVVEALLQQRDPVAAMALLVQWLGQAEEVPLVEEGYSFHDLTLRWMEDLWQEEDEDEQAAKATIGAEQRWPLSRKFLDYLEANAGDFWDVPRFELAGETAQGDEEEEATDDEDNLFSAAYEDVTYRDSTDDGFEGEMLEGGESLTEIELAQESERIVGRLALLSVLAKLWRQAAVASIGKTDDQQRDDVLAGWLDRAVANRRALLELLSAVHRYRIAPPRGSYESLVEYDQHRVIKETLLEQIIAACVEMGDAARMVRAAMQSRKNVAGLDEAWDQPAAPVLRALIRGDADAVREAWRPLIESLLQQPLLYVALERGGSPSRIVAARSIQCLLRRLLAYLPRLGMLQETHWLLETIQDMELEHPVGPGATTEFDHAFRIGCKSIVHCLVVSSEDWASTESRCDDELVALLERATESLLRCWLAHSRGVRLSVLETVQHPDRWNELKQFIERYGGDLFTQHYMNMGNLRAILHQSVDVYLQSLEEEGDADEGFRLLEELDAAITRDEAVRCLTLILEAVVENYAEYVDYNSTTTQSDRGELLYTLLDFLRLRTSYDRVAWNLLPVVLAHDVLVRCERDGAATTWREAVAQRTQEIADDHLQRLARLTRKYGMRLQSVADRLGERFTRPLLIDRLRGFVRPAIEERQTGRSGKALKRLEEEIAPFTEEISGAGFDVPGWLEALEQEVDRIQTHQVVEEQGPDPYLHIPQVRLSLDEAEDEVDAMADEE